MVDRKEQPKNRTARKITSHTGELILANSLANNIYRNKYFTA